MLLYRVFPYDPAARAGAPGHHSYRPRSQGKGRLDNVEEYDCWYLAGEPAGAVGETFGDLWRWTSAMFATPFLPSARRALGTYRIPDATPILDLDDARNLLDRRLRPTQVIVRDPSVTRAWALAIFREREADGTRRWSGVRWWSYHRPQWHIHGLWELVPECVSVEPLALDHPAVADAATALNRPTDAS